MKKITFLSALFLIGNLSAGIIADINKQYIDTNPDLSVPEAPRLRLEFIITNANQMIDSYELMRNVNKEVAATNAIVNAALERQWRAEHPNQKFEVTIRAVWASNDVNNATLVTDWLVNNPTNGLTVKKFSCYTNKNGRVEQSYVDISTNWLFTIREKKAYKALQSEYYANKYDVIGALSQQDYITYTNQTACYKEITKDLKIIIDNCNYMKNYASITNSRHQAEIKKQQDAAKKEAERIANTLTDSQEERYYEIIEEMEEQGINPDEDVTLLKTARRKGKVVKDMRGVNRLVSAASTNDTSSFSAKLRFIKSLSKEDQRIFKVGNKKFRNKNENLYKSLTETQWAKYREIKNHSSELETNSAKLEYMNTLSEDDRLVYKSAKKLIRDMKKAAKDRANKK